MQAPKIDERTFEQIVKQTTELAQEYTKEKGAAWHQQPGQMDAGGALIRIFAHFAEHVIDRLNQVPEKNFLRFLNLIGARITPPQAARVPLTFFLAANSPVNAFVPAGTQVAAPPTGAESKEVIFETEGALVVTRSQLKAVYMYDPNPKEKKYREYTQQALEGKGKTFPIFTGDKPIECYLYLACDPLLTQPGKKKVTFNLSSPDLALHWKKWFYWDGKEWADVTPSSKNKGWPVTIEDLPPLVIQAVNGVEAGWLRVTVDESANDNEVLAAIANMTVSVDNTSVSPEWGFSNNLPLDLSKDFYPFGETPRFNDTFYLAYHGHLAQPSTKVTIDLKLTNPANSKNDDTKLASDQNDKAKLESKENNGTEPVNTSHQMQQANDGSKPASNKSDERSDQNDEPKLVSNQNDGPKPVYTSGKAQLAWEVWDGTAWQELGHSNSFDTGSEAEQAEQAEKASNSNFEDNTRAFTKSDTVQCTLPDKIKPTTVNGKLAYWLRVRLISGNYGVRAEYTEERQLCGYKLKKATLAPPVVKTIKLSYEMAQVPLSHCQL